MELKEFLNTSLTPYHVVKNATELLKKNGFCELKLSEKWNLTVGGKYYIVKNGTAFFAFVIGEKFVFDIAISHTDSPCLKIKTNETIPSEEGARINVEKYGGLILYSLMDAPLKVAGRIVFSDGKNLATEVVESKYKLTIPSLAIHHNPTVNEGFAPNVQNDMLPLLGNSNEVYRTLTDKKVLDADLFVVPVIEAYENGVDGEYLSSPRIDNLTSVYSSIKGIIECAPESVSIIGCFDNEETGSRTKQGADSSLTETVLKKITVGLGRSEDDYVSACEKGFILSIDNAHACHPAHPEKADVGKKVCLNKGIVIKHHTNYSTDGYSSAFIKKTLTDVGAEYQDYYNRSDLRCGSTIGLMVGARLGMNACDIGLAQLAMHSGVETVGKYDLEKMDVCVKTFLNK